MKLEFSAPVAVIFGLKNKGVTSTGTEKDNTGHHHILFNRALFGEAEDDAEAKKNGHPADDSHKRFGGGQIQVITISVE